MPVGVEDARDRRLVELPDGSRGTLYFVIAAQAGEPATAVVELPDGTVVHVPAVDVAVA